MLVIVERALEAQVALQKASVMARHFGAGIEIFSCAAERTWSRRSVSGGQGADEARAGCLADSKRLLDALRSSIAADDITIDMSHDCENTLHEGVERKIADSRPDLVVWCVTTSAEERHAPLSAGERRVIRKLSAPLLLARRRSWAPQPRLLAAIDLSQGCFAPSALAVLDAADRLAEGCQGELGIAILDAPREHADAVTALRRSGLRMPGRAAQAEMLGSSSQQALASRVVADGVDVLVLHRPALSDGNDRLAEVLIESLECDLLLLPAMPEPPCNPRCGDSAGRASLPADPHYCQPSECAYH